MENDLVTVKFTDREIDVDDLTSPIWLEAEARSVTTYWNGEQAPIGRHFSFAMLWSEKHLYVRFEANIGEPPVVSQKPDTTKKTIGLWDRDVCEIFVAPDQESPQKYFEFEAAPTGEWLDVAIDFSGDERVSDWDYLSAMYTASQTIDDKTITAIKMPWSAFGKRPKSGDVWLGNLLRCVGKDPSRGYLAWQPTFTERPNFHVPEVFGRFKFVP